MNRNPAHLSACESSCDCPEGYMCRKMVGQFGACYPEDKPFISNNESQKQQPLKENIEK